MKKKFRLISKLLAVSLCIMTAFSSSACNSYELKDVELACYVYSENTRTSDYNQELFYRNDVDVKFGDPTTVYEKDENGTGWLYMTGTVGGQEGFSCYRSKDFVNWEVMGTLIDMDGFYGVKNFWAPQYFYDPDAKYEDYNVEKEEGEDGTGLYFLSFSARPGMDVTLERDGLEPDIPYVNVTISKNPYGPFKFFEGTNRNGVQMDASVPLFHIEYINPETGINLDENATPGSELYRKAAAFIDQCFFIDPETDKKYMYMVGRGEGGIRSVIYGVEMIDWVTPKYETFTRLTSFSWTKVIGSENNEKYDWQPPPSFQIDEGPFPVYHNGKYYLTFSMGGTSSQRYPVVQAIGDSPLGPFTKIQPKDGGFVCAIEENWDMFNSGHHSFVEIEGELWIVYHSCNISTDWVKDERGPCYDRVRWITNSKGQEVMTTNGPSKMLTPLPEIYSGYKNIALSASVKATGGISGTDAKYLNDDYIKMRYKEPVITDFEAKSKTKITLSWDDYITARAILVYNSCEFFKTFSQIDKVTLHYIDDQGRRGKAYYKNWKFDMETAMVPLWTMFTEEERAEMELGDYCEMRGSSAAVMEFADIKINKIEFEIKKAKTSDSLSISEIVVLGKEQ